jgi:formylmethanofuran dehydrogenase subunit A
VTIYDDRPDREEMFALPRYVIKGGRVVVRDGELVEALAGELLRVDAPHDPAVEDVLRERFEERYTVQFDNYPVREPWLLEPARRVRAGRST